MAVCYFVKVILRGQQIYTVIQDVHSLFYIVAKCHFFSVVTWKHIIKCLQKCEGCTIYILVLSIYILIYNLNIFNSPINNHHHTIPKQSVSYKLVSFTDNWVRELKLWCPSFKVLVYYGKSKLFLFLLFNLILVKFIHLFIAPLSLSLSLSLCLCIYIYIM